MTESIIGLSSMTSEPKPPIFILGCQRSGTSLIRRILDSHSSIACPPESGFIVQLVHKRIRQKMLLVLCVLLVPALLTVGCSGHPEGLDNPRDLTAVQKDMTVEIALGTPESKMHLEQGQEYRTWLHWMAVVWDNSEWSALHTIQYEWKTDPNYKLVPVEAVFYPAVTIIFGEPQEWVVTVAVALDQGKAALVQEYPAQKGPQ